MAKKVASNVSTRADLEDELRHFVQSCYPDLHYRTYCVPPCIMNRVPYVRRVVAGQPVLLTSYSPGADQEPPVSLQQQDTVRQPQSLWEREIHRKWRPTGAEKQVQASPFASPQQNIDRPPQTLWAREFRPNSKPLRVMDCDVRDDFAQQHVLHCLHKLGQKRQEVMFIISQLMFGNYLNKPLHEKFPSVLPRPADLPRRFIDRADCDVLIVHQNHGILLGEIKSVGFNSAGLTPEEFEKVLAKRIKKAVKQLHKSEMVVQHIFHDLAPDLKVRHTIILPYVSSTQLQRVLENDSKLANDVCQLLGATNVEEATSLCLCADQLSDRDTPFHVPEEIFATLDIWFDQRMANSNDQCMSPEAYLRIVSRLVGPASTVAVHCVVPPRVEIRTEGEAVSETGERLSRLVLTEQQMSILCRQPQNVCLFGPPGTGKTTMLVLMGLTYLKLGKDVYIVSTTLGSLAASLLIYHQIQVTLSSDPDMRLTETGRVHFLQLDLVNREDDAIVALNVFETAAAATPDRSIGIIMDEIQFDNRRLLGMLNELHQRVPSLSIWAATLGHFRVSQIIMQAEMLSVPLRCAPAVQREVSRAVSRYDHLERYSSNSTPSPSDGPRVIRLCHHGGDHAGVEPILCFRCGQNVAHVLRQLGVGMGETTARGREPITRPPCLQFRDVFVLTRDYRMLQDTDVPVTRFTRGLESAGIPVSVCPSHSKDQFIADVAVARHDLVTVTHFSHVAGLERKIVVCLPGTWPRFDTSLRDKEEIDTNDGLFLFSRCTTQLVVVEVPDAVAH